MHIHQLSNERYGLDVPDQQMDAKLDVVLEKMRALAAGEKEPQDNEEHYLRYIGLFALHECTKEQKACIEKLTLDWSTRRFVLLQIKFKKPHKTRLENLPTEEEMLAGFEGISQEVKTQPLKKAK